MRYKDVKTFWIGGKNNSVGKWTWFSTGEVINYPPWINAQPNGTGDCIQIWNFINFNLDDVNCEYHKTDAFICQSGETRTEDTHWSVRVRTSDIERAGTNDNVFLKIVGTKGQTNDLHLYKRNRRDKNDTYTFHSVNIGKHRYIKVWKTGKDNWHPETIEMKEEGDLWRVYHINRWIGVAQNNEVTINAPEHPLITCSKVDQETKIFVPFVCFTVGWLVVVLLTLPASNSFFIRPRPRRERRKNRFFNTVKRLKSGAGNIFRNVVEAKTNRRGPRNPRNPRNPRDPRSRDYGKAKKQRGFFGRMWYSVKTTFGGRRDSEESDEPRRLPNKGSRYSSKRKTDSRYSRQSMSTRRSTFSKRRTSPESSSDSSDDSGSSDSGSS